MEEIERGKNGINYLYDRIHTYEKHFEYLQETKGIECAADYIQLQIKYNYLESLYEKLGRDFNKLLDDYNEIRLCSQ